VLREVDTALSVDVDCRPRELETLELETLELETLELETLELETLEPWEAEGHKRLSSIMQIVEIRRNRERSTENLKKNIWSL